MMRWAQHPEMKMERNIHIIFHPKVTMVSPMRKSLFQIETLKNRWICSQNEEDTEVSNDGNNSGTDSVGHEDLNQGVSNTHVFDDFSNTSSQSLPKNNGETNDEKTWESSKSIIYLICQCLQSLYSSLPLITAFQSLLSSVWKGFIIPWS